MRTGRRVGGRGSSHDQSNEHGKQTKPQEPPRCQHRCLPFRVRRNRTPCVTLKLDSGLADIVRSFFQSFVRGDK